MDKKTKVTKDNSDSDEAEYKRSKKSVPEQKTDETKIKYPPMIRAISIHEMNEKLDILCTTKNISDINIFYRGKINTLLNDSSKMVLRKAIEYNNNSIKYVHQSYRCNDFVIHICLIGTESGEGMTKTKYITIITNETYERRYVVNLIQEISKSISSCSSESDVQALLDRMMAAYIKPVDKIDQINDSLFAIKSVMTKNIEQILSRGETIDGLVMKSKDLDDNSKKYFIRARKANRRCPGCIIL
jgi:hypothetical protein